MSVDEMRELELWAEALIDDHDHMREALIELRRRHKLTQAQVGERMGVSQPVVAAFERYDANPTLATVRRYALAVGAMIDTRVLSAATPRPRVRE